MPATATTIDYPAVPRVVTAATAAWLAAIGAGVGEALLRSFLLPDPPTTTELAVRFSVYAGLAALVLTLLTGRNAIRWTLALLLGIVGTLSLVMEPIGWLAVGGDPVAYLGAADGPTAAVVGIRMLHVVAVGVAMVLMFRPRASAFFTRGR